MFYFSALEYTIKVGSIESNSRYDYPSPLRISDLTFQILRGPSRVQYPVDIVHSSAKGASLAATSKRSASKVRRSGLLAECHK